MPVANESGASIPRVRGELAKVQALGCREDMPLTIKVQGQDVMVVTEFVYLGSLIHSSTGSTCDINRRSAITRAAMQSLENQIWRSQLGISTKLKLYNTCILPIFLYGSDCWAIPKTDARQIDALNQWCLHMSHSTVTDGTFRRHVDLRVAPCTGVNIYNEHYQ